MKDLSLTFLLLSLIILFSNPAAFSQFDLGDRLKEKVKDKTENAIEDAVDEKMDNVLKKKEPNENTKQDESSETKNTEVKNTETNTTKKTDGLKSYSKFDFIPGDKIIYFDDFAQDNVGDFPAKWNTNSGGETVTLNNYPGKWFKMNYGGIFMPDFTGVLPDNFTVEFDAIYNITDENIGADIQLDFVSSTAGEMMDANVPGNGGCAIKFNGFEFRSMNWLNQSYGDIDNTVESNAFTSASGKIVKISISVQKQRVRLYAGEQKLIDIPRLLPKGIVVDQLKFDVVNVDASVPPFYFSNFRVAVGQPDMRNKLITEGKIVTHGIYFDSGSDKIKPESYATLKEIATVLNSNPDVRVKIVGHTDADGSDTANLELSKRRSASVKISLSTEFGINTTRLETDGKGESVPIDNNSTSEGKANNRRVEFLKL